jgi:putative peptidoglycan lipid II flippase
LIQRLTETRLAKSVVFVFTTSSIRWVLSCLKIVLVAFLFGAAFSYDAYLVAFTVPETIVELLVGIIAVTFIPIFTENLLKDNESKAWEFVFSLINIIFVIGVLIVVLVVGLAPLIVKFIAPGFDYNSLKLASRLITVITPVILLISLSELITRVLQTYGKFVIPALSRVLEIAVTIICLIVFFKRYGIFSLAFGLLLGAVVRLLFQIPILFNKIKYYKFALNFKIEGIRKMLHLSGPLIACMLFLRLGRLIEQMLASTLGEGTISTLGYATALTEVPPELFIGSFGVVLFPLISKFAAEGNIPDFKSTLSKGIRMGNFVLFPIAFLFIFFGRYIVGSLLERGEFSSSMAQNTSIALALYAIGIFASSIYFFATHACYALQKTKSIINIAIFVMIFNIILKLVLIKFLSFKGLAVSTSIALIVHSLLLIRFIRRNIGSFGGKQIFISSLRMFIVSIFMLWSCWLFLSLIPDSFNNLMRLSFLFICAGLSYFILSFLFRSEELSSLNDLFKNMISPRP